MQRIISISLFALGLVFLAGAVYFLPLAEVKAAEEEDVLEEAAPTVITLDVAVDCRTLVSGPGRGATFLINGKIFPGGTFPEGQLTNDPTQPYNGVEPIGDYAVRGQHSFGPPPNIPPDYDRAPFGHATVYFMLKDGRRALITEGYDRPNDEPPFFPPKQALLAVTGGIGGFRGATGDATFSILGRNITTCGPNLPNGANSRAKFILRFVRE
jgi:hypothetical protein